MLGGLALTSIARHQVRFHAHACLAIEGEREDLLTDPWLFGKVFNDSWTLRPPPDLDALDFGRVRHIWISHEHPDHLHAPSLQFIRRRVSGPITAYCARQKRPAVADALRGLGFDVTELVPHRETAMADGVCGTLFPTGEDSALVLRFGDRVILNQNDCSLAPDELAVLHRMFPRLDAWFFQFSLGGYYANAEDRAGLAAARTHHLRLVACYFAMLRPATFVPFASFFYFSKDANCFLNEWVVTLAQLMEALPHLPTQILRPGDTLLWEQWAARNTRNLAYWRAIESAPRTITPHAPIEEAALLAGGRSLLAEVVAQGAARRGPGDTHLEIRDSGRALALDCRNVRVEIVPRADPRKLAITAPADELLYFLRSRHGASVFYTSCFHVANQRRWLRLRRFRHALSRGTASERGATIKMHLARLDRAYLRGVIRRCYRRLTLR